MIMTLPFRLMTLHFSQIGFTEALTFMLYSSFYFSLQVIRPRDRS